jgi:formate hydrogenlyase subunit 3/multisubunit Na+/H+ antiporter MnhD subunit
LALAAIFCAIALGGIGVIVAQDFTLSVSYLELQSYATYLAISNKIGDTEQHHGFLSYFVVSGLATTGLIIGWAIADLEGGILIESRNLGECLSPYILTPSFILKLGVYPFYA